MTRAQILLHGGDAERFEELKAEIADRRGFEPTDPELIRRLMNQFAHDLREQ